MLDPYLKTLLVPLVMPLVIIISFLLLVFELCGIALHNSLNLAEDGPEVRPGFGVLFEALEGKLAVARERLMLQPLVSN